MNSDETFELKESSNKKLLHNTKHFKPLNIEITTNKMSEENQDLMFEVQEEQKEVQYAAIQQKAYVGLENP